MELTPHDILMGAYASYNESVELIKNGDKKFLAYVEGLNSNDRLPYAEFLEKALADLQPTINESVMMELHGRALTLYRTICKEHNHQAKI